MHTDQQIVLLSELKTVDTKYIAVEEAKKLIDERIAEMETLKKYDTKKYVLAERINDLCDMIFMIHIRLAELDEGISYYFKTNVEKGREIVLYKALQLAACLEEDDVWLQIYEYGVKRKIKPRDYLVSEYRKRKAL